MTRAEFEEQEERAAEDELEQLSGLSARELIDRIRQGSFGSQRLSCSHALLSLLPYSGIPTHALADRSHPGHGLYMADLDAVLQKALAQL